MSELSKLPEGLLNLMDFAASKKERTEASLATPIYLKSNQINKIKNTLENGRATALFLLSSKKINEARVVNQITSMTTAITMLQGLLEQGEAQPAATPKLTAQELSSLTRFCETCEDNEGYDVPKTMMQRLAQIGVVRHLSKGIYGITEFGQAAIDGFTHPPAPKLVMLTLDELDDKLPAEWNLIELCASVQQAFCTKNGLTLEASK